MKLQITLSTIALFLSVNSFSQTKMSQKNNSDDSCWTKITAVENLLFADGSVQDVPKFVTKNDEAVDFCSSRKGGKVKAFLKSGQTLCKDAFFTKDKFQYGSCVLKVLKVANTTNPDMGM